MLRVALLQVGLVVGTVLLHYEGLRFIGVLVQSHFHRPRPAIVFVIFGVLALHVLEIAAYAAAYGYTEEVLRLGRVVGDVDGGAFEYLYFSAQTFTTLGLGDLHPEGELRLLASFEPLNGLVLIAWSGSFTYLAVQRYWAGQSEREL